jgi:hypothetical protein
VKLKAAQTAATEPSEKAAAAKCRVESELGCKLTPERKKELEECSKEVKPAPEACSCDDLTVEPMCLCSGDCCGPNAPVVVSPAEDVLKHLANCAKSSADDALAYASLPDTLAATAAQLAKELVDLEAALTTKAMDADRAWLTFHLGILDRLDTFDDWMALGEAKYNTKLEAMVQNAICVRHKLACAVATKAQTDERDRLAKQCQDEESGKDPITRALECLADKCSADPPATGKPVAGKPVATKPVPASAAQATDSTT